MKKIICLYGQPASGKTTQAELLAHKYGFSIFGMGETLRAEVASGSKLGQDIQNYVDSGLLIPDHYMAEIIKSAEAKATGEGLIFDGFPRMVSQAKMLDEILAELNISVSAFMYLQVSPEVALKRLQNRASLNADRADDKNEAAINNRFAVFAEQSLPLIDFYRQRSLLIEINGELSVEEVFDNIKQSLAI